MGNQCCGCSPDEVTRVADHMKQTSDNSSGNVVPPKSMSSKPVDEDFPPLFKDDEDDQSANTEPCSVDGQNSAQDPVGTIYLLVDQMSREAGHFAKSSFSFGRSGSSRSSFSDAREARGENVSAKRVGSYGSRVDGLREDIEDEVDAARSMESLGGDHLQSERSTTTAGG